MCSCNRSTLAYSSASLQPQPDPAAPVRDTRVLNDQQQTCYELLKWIFGGGAKGKMKISILLLGVEESAVRWSQTFPDSRFWYVTGIHRAKVCLHSIGFVAGTGCTVSFICHHVHCYITSFFKKTKDLDFYYIRFYVDGKKQFACFQLWVIWFTERLSLCFTSCCSTHIWISFICAVKICFSIRLFQKS